MSVSTKGKMMNKMTVGKKINDSEKLFLQRIKFGMKTEKPTINENIFGDAKEHECNLLSPKVSNNNILTTGNSLYSSVDEQTKLIQPILESNYDS